MTLRLSTDDLIARLADTPPPAPLRGGRAALAMAAMTGVGIGMGVALFGLSLRPAPLATMAADPAVLAKTALPLVIAALAMAAALRSARPGMASRGWLVGVPALGALAMAAAAARAIPAPELLSAIAGHSAAACLLAVASLAVLPLAMGIAALRRGASTRPALSGALIGLAAGGGAAAVYALFCTEDSPLFFVTWYGAAMLLSAAAGALAGHRVLRW